MNRTCETRPAFAISSHNWNFSLRRSRRTPITYKSNLKWDNWLVFSQELSTTCITFGDAFRTFASLWREKRSGKRDNPYDKLPASLHLCRFWSFRDGDRGSELLHLHEDRYVELLDELDFIFLGDWDHRDHRKYCSLLQCLKSLQISANLNFSVASGSIYWKVAVLLFYALSQFQNDAGSSDVCPCLSPHAASWTGSPTVRKIVFKLSAWQQFFQPLPAAIIAEALWYNVVIKPVTKETDHCEPWDTGARHYSFIPCGTVTVMGRIDEGFL